jgi:glycerol-3-phosphate acyltransferase PlsY
MQDFIVVAILGYLLGNFQASYIFGKLIKKVDIRTLGHGNAGASNAVESLGWKFGVLVAVLDVLKGVVSILLVKYFYKVGFDPDGALLLYINGYSVILGHIFPFYMGFKGGKGTATLIGIMLGMHPWVGLVGMGIIILATFLTDYVAIGTLALTFYVIFTTVFRDLGPGPIIISILGALLSLKLHLINYKRISLGTEGRLSLVLKKKKTT